MLIDIDKDEPIKRMPHAAEFEAWSARLTPQEIAAIENELNSRIDGGEVHTSSWMPGNDWSGTPFFPIYAKACKGNIEMSGLCFGLFVWKVFADRKDEWSFGRYEKNGIPIKGMTYFRVRR